LFQYIYTSIIYFFLANNENKITDAIKSRCGYHLDLNDLPPKEIYNRCVYILKQENVKIEDKNSIIHLIKKCYPDVRKIIGTLQSNVRNGVVKDISFSSTHDLFQETFDLMKKGDPEEVRKKIKSTYFQYDDFYNFLYTKIMDDPDEVKKPGEFIISCGDYLYKNSLIAIEEVNFMAFYFNLLKREII
jgi:DNA polymerase III delta prime subunit